MFCPGSKKEWISDDVLPSDFAEGNFFDVKQLLGIPDTDSLLDALNQDSVWVRTRITYRDGFNHVAIQDFCYLIYLLNLPNDQVSMESRECKYASFALDKKRAYLQDKQKTKGQLDVRRMCANYVVAVNLL